MKWTATLLSLSLVSAGLGASIARAGDSPADQNSTPLIPRRVLFGNPDKAFPQISADGTRLAFLAGVKGVLNVWVGPIGAPDQAKAVTQDDNRGIRNYQWAYDNRHILYLQDKGGDENWHVYATNVETSETRDLTPMNGIQARIVEMSPKLPDEALLAINDRKKEYHDVYRVTLSTGKLKRIVTNDQFGGFLADDDLEPRVAIKISEDGGSEIHVPKGDGWTLEMKIPHEDQQTTSPVGFDKAGKVLYMTDSRGRDTAALVAYDLATKKQTVIASDPKADISKTLFHPTEKTIEAVASTYDVDKWTFLDDKIKAEIDYLRTVSPGEWDVLSRSQDDKHWVVGYLVDNGPVRYYHYDRAAKKANFLFTNRTALEGLSLAKMTPVVIKSRDGLDLVSYLTLPVNSDAKTPGRPAKPVPMVLLVHGGPWARDGWGLNGTHQWLANRGYAVLSVNYRGSTGFGKKFINASNLEWAGKMHDDLLDAVDWAVKEKIADPAKVAIMGGSYGGYATLVGLTFTPDKFACGVDIVGPSSLFTLIQSIPPYWKPILGVFKTRVGDPETPDGKAFLAERSPLSHVAKIKRPLLIGQGANDPRVKQAEADQIVRAMKEKKIPVTYVLFPDEGHGFRRPENSKAFNAVAEAFLAQHLGGRSEPIGEDFQGSSIKIPEGADQIPGVKAPGK